MAQDRAKQLLQQGIASAKAGQKAEAFQTLQQAVKIDPRNETAWLWLSSVARNDQERIFCLKQLLAINPQNEMAVKGLKALGIEPEAAKEQSNVPQTTVPQVAPEKINTLQQPLDELLRSYNPQLYTPLEIEWVHKEGKRYGEGAARRLQTSVYLTGAVIAIVVLALLAFLLLNILGSDEEGGLQQSIIRTRIPSLTPSITFTPTQIVNTPLPPDIATPTAVPVQANVPRGHPQVNPTATLPYPPYQASIRNDMQRVISFYGAKDYAAAAESASSIRSSQQAVCYQEVYYYEALSLINQGGRTRLNQAEQLLTEGINAQREPGFDNTCKDSDLLRAGMCYVKHQEAIFDFPNIDAAQLGEALSFCSTAHNNDPRLVPAAANMAQVYLTMGDTNSLNNAFSVVEETLNADANNRGNTILLMRLADIELARARYQQALVYLETALYVDPVLEEALQKRVEAHLQIAAQQADSQDRLIRYGLAATYADYYLFYYAGSPEAYILQAEARLGEGKPERALYTLSQVINVEDELPDSKEAVVQKAYTLRAGIYLARQDWDAAYNDLERLRVLDPNNPQWQQSAVTALLHLERYGEALTEIEALREDDPLNPELTLAQAEILARTCQFDRSLECNYRLVANELITDEFIATLTAGSPAWVNAQSYRLEADFDLLSDNEVDTEDEDAVAEYTAILESLRDRALVLVGFRQDAADYYLLGRIYDRLDQSRLAANAYEWVVYWDRLYQYPFSEAVNEALVNALEKVAESDSVEES